MSMLKEFKEFAVKGNVVDMAVGVIIGAAFGKIVSTLVAKVVTPPIGLLLGGVNFVDLKFILQESSEGVAEVAIEYGAFLQVTFDFLIVAFVIFMAVKGINNLKKKADEAPAAPIEPPKEQILLEEIRDLLKQK